MINLYFHIQVPEVLSSLQCSVQAACVGYHVAQGWMEAGVTKSALVDKWPVYDMASDGMLHWELFLLFCRV